MISRNADSSQGEGCGTSSPIVPDDRGRAADTANAVFKSGPLFISSKGIGWTSWKKRWFILTRTSLVFFRSEPSALPSKGGDVNLTLGGIDLNNSGSVVVRADKKLLTVLFPDGREGRAFTLKAETSEDMYEWKAALENALAQAPNAALVVGQNGIFRNDTADTVEGSVEQCKDRPVKSMVVGRPILLALEDIDGSPSFLEKALRFIEEYGIKVEGILRQSADVEEVERRVREYEEGKNAFSPDEDAHVVGDCVKHILRESPSSPVPASCCTALLEAYRNGHGDRVDSLRGAISEAFPEPNRRLLERILRMMQTVSFHTSVNRMSSSAVAACMAPLLLRPLMAGDCELKDDFGMNGDGCSAQLLAAAAAANHAHAIVSILLEEYDYIFADDHSQRGPVSSEMYSGSEEESGSERSTDDAIMDIEEDGYHDADHDHDVDSEEDSERLLSETLSESSGIAGSDLSDNKVQFSEGLDSDADSSKDRSCSEGDRRPLRARSLSHVHDSLQIRSGNLQTEEDNSLGLNDSESRDSLGDFFTSTSLKLDSSGFSISSCSAQSKSKVNGSVSNTKRPTVWGRTGARKNLPMDSIDSSVEDEIAIQRLEATKNDLQNKIAKEAKGNAILQASLERRKQALHERRLALEQDVARLQEQLQRERDLRATLEAGLNMALGNFISSKMDSKVRVELEETAIAEADVINLKQKVADLHLQLNQQRHHNCSSLCESCSQHQCAQNHEVAQKKTQAQDFESKVVVSPLERSQICEDFSSGIDTERVRTQDETSLQNKEPPQRQQTNSPIPAGSTSNGISASPSIEPLTVATSTSKKLSAKKKLDLPSGVDSEKVTTPDKPSLQNMEPDQRQHMDSPIPSGSRSTVPSTITSTEPLTVASSNSFKKPSATKNESPLPNNAADERSGVTRPKQSNAPLEVVDLEIADIIELEKVRQWKDLMSRADAEKGTSKDQPSLQSKELPHGQSPDLPIRAGSRSSMASANPSTEPLSTSAKKHSWKKSWDFSSGLDLEKVRSQDKPSLQNKETHNRQRPDSPIPTGARSAVASAIPSIEPTVAPGTSAKKNSLKKSWDFSFGLDWEKVKTHDKPSSQNKEPLHKQLPESSSPAGSKSTIAFPNPSNEERSTAAPSMSKKHNAKSEGRSSAFSKLSVRLNFMKEKRSQIIAELQNFRVNSSPDSQALTKTELS